MSGTDLDSVLARLEDAGATLAEIAETKDAYGRRDRRGSRFVGASGTKAAAEHIAAGGSCSRQPYPSEGYGAKAGTGLVCQVRPVADLLALHLDHHGVQGVTVRSIPVGDLGALFHEHGHKADDLTLLEAQTTGSDDLIDWVRELAGRVARHVRDDEA